MFKETLPPNDKRFELAEDDWERFEEVFEEIDENRDGKITKYEMTILFKKFAGVD